MWIRIWGRPHTKSLFTVVADFKEANLQKIIQAEQSEMNSLLDKATYKVMSFCKSLIKIKDFSYSKFTNKFVLHLEYRYYEYIAKWNKST